MNIMDTYKEYREHSEDGDIVLFHGTRKIHRLIQQFDRVDGKPAYWNHSGNVVKIGNRVMFLEATEKGVDITFLSRVMKRFTDFAVLCPLTSVVSHDRMLVETNIALGVAEEFIAYDFAQLFKILLWRKGIKYWWNNNPDKDICSEVSQNIYVNAGIQCYRPSVIKQPFITPQDFVRFGDESEIKYKTY